MDETVSSSPAEEVWRLPLKGKTTLSHNKGTERECEMSGFAVAVDTLTSPEKFTGPRRRSQWSLQEFLRQARSMSVSQSGLQRFNSNHRSSTCPKFQVPSSKSQIIHCLSLRHRIKSLWMVTMWTFGPVSGSKSSVIFKEGVDE